MIIKPFKTYILVDIIEHKQTLVSDTKPLCEYGTVVAIGNEVKEIKVGDVVAFMKWGLNEIDIEGKRCSFISETSDFLLSKLEL